MKNSRSIWFVHGVGALLLGLVLSLGYVYGVRPWALVASRSAVLESKYAEYEAVLRARPQPEDRGVVRGADVAQNDSEGKDSVSEVPSLTPTMFLSLFEDTARQIGLRVESSKELGSINAFGKKNPKEREASPASLLVEITGTGTFAEIMSLCVGLEKPLPGLEIQRLRVERNQDEMVRWTMVCVNYAEIMGSD